MLTKNPSFLRFNRTRSRKRMLLHRLNSNVLVIRNNNWSRDWLSPAFFVFLSALWHVLLFPLIFEFDDQFVYWFTHGIFLGTR